jgi:pimeloyl-ACP methyl ester carboxylesterase
MQRRLLYSILGAAALITASCRDKTLSGIPSPDVTFVHVNTLPVCNANRISISPKGEIAIWTGEQNDLSNLAAPFHFTFLSIAHLDRLKDGFRFVDGPVLARPVYWSQSGSQLIIRHKARDIGFVDLRTFEYTKQFVLPAAFDRMHLAATERGLTRSNIEIARSEIEGRGAFKNLRTAWAVFGEGAPAIYPMSRDTYVIEDPRGQTITDGQWGRSFHPMYGSKSGHVAPFEMIDSARKTWVAPILDETTGVQAATLEMNSIRLKVGYRELSLNSVSPYFITATANATNIVALGSARPQSMQLHTINRKNGKLTTREICVGTKRSMKYRDSKFDVELMSIPLDMSGTSTPVPGYIVRNTRRPPSGPAKRQLMMFFHGGPGVSARDALFVPNVVAALTEGFDVAVFDYPGSAGSLALADAAKNSKTAMPIFASSLTKWHQSLGKQYDRTVVIAESFGSLPALTFLQKNAAVKDAAFVVPLVTLREPKEWFAGDPMSRFGASAASQLKFERLALGGDEGRNAVRDQLRFLWAEAIERNTLTLVLAGRDGRTGQAALDIPAIKAKGHIVIEAAASTHETINSEAKVQGEIIRFLRRQS